MDGLGRARRRRGAGGACIRTAGGRAGCGGRLRGPRRPRWDGADVGEASPELVGAAVRGWRDQAAAGLRMGPDGWGATVARRVKRVPRAGCLLRRDPPGPVDEAGARGRSRERGRDSASRRGAPRRRRSSPAASRSSAKTRAASKCHDRGDAPRTRRLSCRRRKGDAVDGVAGLGRSDGRRDRGACRRPRAVVRPGGGRRTALRATTHGAQAQADLLSAKPCSGPRRNLDETRSGRFDGARERHARERAEPPTRRSWKITPRVKRRPERTRLTPWRTAARVDAPGARTGRCRLANTTASPSPAEQRLADRLGPGPLLDEQELAALVVAAGPAQEDGELQRERHRAVEVLVQRVVAARLVAQQEGRGPRLARRRGNGRGSRRAAAGSVRRTAEAPPPTGWRRVRGAGRRETRSSSTSGGRGRAKYLYSPTPKRCRSMSTRERKRRRPRRGR